MLNKQTDHLYKNNQKKIADNKLFYYAKQTDCGTCCIPQKHQTNMWTKILSGLGNPREVCHVGTPWICGKDEFFGILIYKLQPYFQFPCP